ncbi:RYamide receptor-like [Oppia nitens]|uniref:RYamide receptor-like n=1 Tax=Oppia nitens TaxID=1686743 RepID=UPI0023DB24A9|nr:RYamide receptor-like [Oppia nitens]
MDLYWYSNNNTHINLTNYTIIDELGPQLEAIPSKYHIIVVLVYTVTAVCALLANALAIWVLASGTRTSAEMSKYLINLSVSDIIMSAFSTPFSYTNFMYGRWLFWPGFCPVVLSIQVLSMFVSIYTLIAIGIDRYYAIVRPLDTGNWLKNFPRVTIAAIWFAALCICLVTYFNSEAVEFVWPATNQTYYDCRETWTDRAGKVYTISMFVITFAAPVLVMVFVYSCMAHAVSHRRQLGRHLSTHLSRQKTQIIKLLITVVLAFIICWTGIQLFGIVVWLFPQLMRFSTKAKYYGYVGIYFTLNWISMFHSTVNPIIYTFVSDNFRSDLKSVLQKFFKNRHLLSRFGTNNSSTGSRRSQTSQTSNKTIISFNTNDSSVEVALIN